MPLSSASPSSFEINPDWNQAQIQFELKDHLKKIGVDEGTASVIIEDVASRKNHAYAMASLIQHLEPFGEVRWTKDPDPFLLQKIANIRHSKKSALSP